MSVLRPGVAVLGLLAASCTCGPSSSTPSVCDSLQRYQAALSARSLPCILDGGLIITGGAGSASAETCRAAENTCSESDRLAVLAGADCAEGFATCAPGDGGSFTWTLGFTLACGSTLATVSPPCQEAVGQ